MTQEQDLSPAEDEPVAPAAAPARESAPVTTLSADLVRNSPEFRELQRQNRELARKAGDAQAAEARTRSDAEAARQAAEAQRLDAVQAQLQQTLGDDGVAFWNQFAELSATDPLAAAQALQDFRASGQTTPVKPATPAGTPATGGSSMPAQGTGAPPPASSGLFADSPLGSMNPQESDDALLAGMAKRVDEITERNNNPATRNRVTEKERSEGIMAIFGSGVVKAIAARRSANR